MSDAIELPSFLVSILINSPGCCRSATDRLGRLQSGEPVRAKPAQDAAHGAADTPTSAAICLPVWHCRRNASTAEHVAGGVWLGN
ncbi:hypothetical protein CQ10_39880 [Bradyrhizobium valentinum]|nr:hypothetical protein CQ10_39880 [Bradyrhizobium valentinum]